MSSKKVIVIGAGLGGFSAAISLRQSGYDVEIFEKNDKIGGKLNVLKPQGYTRSTSGRPSSLCRTCLSDCSSAAGIK